MTFDELKEMIKKDISLDETQLDRESVRTPQIHNKYLIFFMEEKLSLTRMNTELDSLKTKKWLYYSGRMSADELKENEWEQFDLHVLKQDLDRLIESDSAVIRQRMKVEYQKEKVSYLENVIKIINNRQWTIRSIIDWTKFTSGQ
jgi:Recombination, repair and ssDNA binding protein UvsY